MSFLSRSTDTFYAFRFLRLLTTPWEKTGAFKAGIIDENGKILRKADRLDDKDVYNFFHRLVFNVKRLINKVPFGKSKIASYLTALYLIKEETGLCDNEIMSVLREALNDAKLDIPINESTDKILAEGSYTLKNDVPMPKTGEILALKGTTVIAESNLSPHGYIFSFPQFEVLHTQTNKAILVNITDLEQ